MGGLAPTFCNGVQGPRGCPDPQNDRFPILKHMEQFYSHPKCSLVSALVKGVHFVLSTYEEISPGVRDCEPVAARRGNVGEVALPTTPTQPFQDRWLTDWDLGDWGLMI